jgi:hypothetical protein
MDEAIQRIEKRKRRDGKGGRREEADNIRVANARDPKL